MQFLAWLLARGGASKDLNSQPFLHMHEEEPYSEQRIAKRKLDKSAPEHLRSPSPRKFHRALEYPPRRATPTSTGCNHMEIDNLGLLHGCIGLHMPIHLNTCAFWDREDLEGSWRTKVQTFLLGFWHMGKLVRRPTRRLCNIFSMSVLSPRECRTQSLHLVIYQFLL
jgi:hypothetical protein